MVITEVNVPITQAQAKTLAEESDPMFILEHRNDGSLLIGNNTTQETGSCVWMDKEGRWLRPPM